MSRYVNLDDDRLMQILYDEANQAEAIYRRLCEIADDDVQPVRRGKWMDVYKNFETAECSLCHSQFEVTFEKESNGALWDGFKQFYNYCPNCGAKMEEENEV